MVVGAVNFNIVQTPVKVRAEKFINLSDEEVLCLAQKQASCDKKTREQEDTTRTLIKAVPIVDSMLAVSQKKITLMGLAEAGSLATSLGIFCSRLASWGLLFGAFDLTLKMTDKLTKKSKTLSDMKENHPIAKSLLDLAVILAVYKNGRKAFNYAIKSMPPSLRNKGVEFLSSLKYSIDSSNIAKKIYKPTLDKLLKTSGKHPELMAKVRALQPLVLPAMLIASFVKLVLIDPFTYSKKVANNYINIKLEQEAARELLDIGSDPFKNEEHDES